VAARGRRELDRDERDGGVAVPYLLAGTVAEVLGPGRRRAFWLLRSIGLVAYLLIAASGNAGIATMLACEALTMVSVLVLWVWAAHRHHPLARPVLVAIVVSIAAAGMKAVNPELLRPVALGPRPRITWRRSPAW